MDSRTRTETKTSTFGSGRRESHDASAFYARFAPPIISDDETVNRPDDLLTEVGPGRVYTGSIDALTNLPDNSVALVVTSPPYFVGKDYELAINEGGENGAGPIPSTYLDFLDMLRRVFAECRRVLEPGGRIAVNVANLGRKPYRSLSADVISILQDDLGLLLRGEVIWEKSSASSGSCAWGSFGRASNPVLRDVTERVVIASKGRFARAISVRDRESQGLPHRSTMTNDEFVDVTRDVWRLDAESAKRVGHPAPFPIDLPRRLIDLYTYVGDLVVDPFAGSGTTLVAAARTGRIGIGYDTDPTYVDLSNERLEAELAARDDADGTIHDLGGFERTVDLAVTEGKKVHDIARRHLTDAGFVVVGENVRHPSKLLELSFLVDGAGGEWWVDVAGAFITGNAGLSRTDSVWRLIGRLHAIAAAAPADGNAAGDSGNSTGHDRRVLVLTPQLPRRRSPADRALRSVGPGVLFDCVELYDSAGDERLRAYATGAAPEAIGGFWQEGDLPAQQLVD